MSDFIPNKIPLVERMWRVVLALLILAYAGYGVYLGDFHIVAGYNTGYRAGDVASLHFSGVAAYLLAVALLCACAELLCVVVDHYDKRDNERKYRDFAKLAEKVGIAFCVVAYLIAVISGMNA